MKITRAVFGAGVLLSVLSGGLLGMDALRGTALAEAKVVVELKDAAGKAANGEVSLYTKTGEKIATCKTTDGRCEMSNVAGGNYEVRVVPTTGAAPKPRSAMIPPDGTAKLIVSTGS